MEFVLIVIMLIIYFLPLIVANSRKHKSQLAIFMTCLLLGWTLLGWAIALIWACNSNVSK